MVKTVGKSVSRFTLLSFMTGVLKVNEKSYAVPTGQGQVGELSFGARLITRAFKVHENNYERPPNSFRQGSPGCQ